MKRQSAAHLIDLLFPLALFCAFAATSLLVVVIGADVYRRTAEGMDRNFALRTPLACISQAMHRGDLADGVSVSEFGDGTALVFREEIYGEEYFTYLYCFEGELRELFVLATGQAAPENGQTIAACNAFTVTSETPGLYRVRCVTPGGDEAEALVGLRSANRAEPQPAAP